MSKNDENDNKRYFIIDTDAGSDDAVAICFSLWSKLIDVVAITVSGGNIPGKLAASNTSRLVASLTNDKFIDEINNNCKPKVYIGCEEGIMGPSNTFVWSGHGKDGFGQALLPNSSIKKINDDVQDDDKDQKKDEPKKKKKDDKDEQKKMDNQKNKKDDKYKQKNKDDKDEQKNKDNKDDEDTNDILGSVKAAVKIVELAHKYKGKLELLCIGPLTNLALALLIDGTIAKKIKHCFIMGGSTFARGNSITVKGNRAAEFNFYCDPEAASIVFKKLTAKQLILIPWEICEAHVLTWSDYDKFMDNDTNIAQCCHEITETFERLFRKDYWEHRSGRLLCMWEKKYKRHTLKGTNLEKALNKALKEEKLHHTEHHVLVPDYERGYMPCDLYAAAVAVFWDDNLNDVVGTNAQNHKVKNKMTTELMQVEAIVETISPNTRGGIFMNWYNQVVPNCTIVNAIDHKAFLEYVLEMFSGKK